MKLKGKFPYSHFKVFGIFTMLTVVFIIQSLIPDIYSGTLAKYNWGFNASPIVSRYLWWVLLTPLVYLSMPYLTWQKSRKHSINLAAILLFGPLLAFAHGLIHYWSFIGLYQLYSPFDISGAMEHIMRSAYAGTVGSFIEMWAIIGAFSALEYYRRFQQHQMKLLSAEKDLADARLTSLRMQLNPHFLFNAFNSVISLIDSNKDHAKDMLSELSSLMRHLLSQDKRHTITLAQEIEFNKRYLDIESIRFQDRLTIVMDITANAQEALVPNLILQPLIENALKHGFAQTVGDCQVSISATINEERLILCVADNGKGCSNPDMAIGTGVGLTNVQKRLEQMFGDDFSVNIQRVLPSGFQISLDIPYIYSTLRTR